MQKLAKKNVGSSIHYAGFDGNTYNARITAMHKGVAIIEYAVRTARGTMQMVIAYIDRPFHNRITVL